MDLDVIKKVILPVGIDWMGFIRMKSGFFQTRPAKRAA